MLAQLAAAHDGPVLEVGLTGASATRAQLVSRLERAIRRHGLSDLTTMFARPDPIDPHRTLLRWSDLHDERLLVQIDDVHLADDDLVRFIADLGDRWPQPHRLMLAGRRLPEPVRGCLIGSDRVLIGPDELRFRPDEVRELLGRSVAEELDDGDVALMTARCDGWAAAVGLAAGRLQRAVGRRDGEVRREAAELARRPSTVGDLLDALLEPTASDLREAVAQLCLLPAVDDDLARAAGFDQGVSGLTDLGLPLEPVAPSLWVFPDVVRETLRPPVRDERLTRTAAQRYVEVGVPDAALEVLQSAGLEEDLAKLLVDLPPALIGQLDAAGHAAAVAAVPHHLLVAHPRILLHLADSYLLVGRSDVYAETIARAAALLEERDPRDGFEDPEALEVRAVALTVRVVARNDDALVAEARDLLDRPDLPLMARARLRAAVGRAIATRRTAPALREAAREIDAAARAFQRADASVHAVGANVIAATFASIPLGRYEVALEQFDRALAAAPGDASVRLAVLPYRAFVLVDLGRYAEVEAVLAELRRTAATGLLGNDRSAAFGRWAAARMASQQGDAETTWAACRAVERSDVAVDTANGAFFRADAAQLHARVGWFDEAERLLADARARDPRGSDPVEVAELAVAAHAGDHARARASLDRLDGGAVVEPRARWRVTLLHAYVCHRAGDEAARRLAAAAFEEAAQLGHADLPLIQEPGIARELLPIAEGGSASARDAAKADGARIRLLGGLDVVHAGRRYEPGGRPGQLIAFLALHDRQASVDQVIEALWPDSDTGRGRERLRTVLRRVRRDHADLIERHDGLLRLGEQVTIDVEEFLGFCRRAAEPSTDRERPAAAALALYRGEPVPGLGHLAWVAPHRRHLEEWTLAMHDVVADETAADGRLDDAIRSLLTALEFDPIAERRYLVAARLLAEQGRRARALLLLGEAESALADAGLEPTIELRRLERYLGRNPAMDAAEAS